MSRLVALLAAIAALVAPAAWATPLELYGQLPSIEVLSISPDGARLGVIWTNGEERRIAIQELSDNKLSHVLGVGQNKVRALHWAGPDHLIITTSRTAVIQDVIAPRSEYFLAFDYNLTTRKLRPLLADATRSLNIIYDEPAVRMIDGKPVVFVQGVYFMDNHGALSVFRINLDRDSSKLVESGVPDTRDWLVGQDGAVLAQTVYNQRSGRWALKLKNGAGWRESRVVEALGERPALLGLGRDGRSVLMAELLDGATVLREVSPDGVWGEPLAVREAQGAIFDPERHNLIGDCALVGEEDRCTFFDPQDQKVWRAVQKAYPGQRLRLASWSNDRQKIVVLVDSPTEGPAYALVDLATRKASWLGGQYEKLRPEDIAPVRPIRFKAQDGLELSGYLTTPRGVEPKNLPLVVFPHGGPAARDEPGFDWWAQAMASRGYAVLQVNFRGSDGLGWDFLQAGFGQWGRKMQTDLSDGVRHLAAQGTIDPRRVCIVGGSYGGYAAMAGPSLDPGVYRCAAAYAGPSDMRRFVAWSRNQNGLSALRYWTRFMGAESARDPSLSEISPAMHVDRVTVPMLLIHGKDDTTVPLEQSRIMADALKAAGKPVELLVLDSTDHWLTRGDTRLAMLQAVVAFLEKNNPPH